MPEPVGQQTCSRSGRTRDISVRGVYLIVDKDIDTGAILNLTVTLPGKLTGGGEVLIQFVGKVARVEELVLPYPTKTGHGRRRSEPARAASQNVAVLVDLAQRHSFTVTTDMQVYICDPQSPW